MANDPLFIVAMIACLFVALILIIGVAGFGKGGAFNKKYGNKLMQWRIGAQFVAVLLILAFVLFGGQGG